MCEIVNLDTMFGQLNSTRAAQICCHNADNIHQIVFLNENLQILIKISMKLALKSQNNDMSSLFCVKCWVPFEQIAGVLLVQEFTLWKQDGLTII